MLDGFEAYKLFVAIRNHFTTPSYDFVKYQGKTNVTYASYSKRKDKYQFDKLGRLTTPRLRIVCSFVEGIQWINDVVGQPGTDALVKHQRYIEACSYSFKNELSELPQPLAELVTIKNGCPKLAQLYFQKKVSLETLMLIDSLVDFASIWSAKHDPLIDKLLQTMADYKAFFIYEKRKIQQVFVDFYINKQ